ncbi:MAG: GNAT family N-acetyltransferase [Dehalococcoidia bacterium]
MAVEIRPVSEEERPRAQVILSYAFTGDRSDDMHERTGYLDQFGQAYGLYEDGEMVACLTVFRLRMFLQGASLPLGGVVGVACLPEHRRKGYVGQLLRYALERMREDGQPLSALHTPHPSLYRRYGWMFASDAVLHKFRPKEIAPISAARPKGSAQRLTEEDWPAVAELYKRFAAPRNGYLDRDEGWWREAFFRRIYDEKRVPNDVAMWSGEDGEPRGYIVYRTFNENAPIGESGGRVHVEEFVALDGDAHEGLLRYLLSHDLAREITMWAPGNSPLTLTVDEPWNVKREQFYGFMLRIVDIEAAMGQRPPSADAPEGAFTVAISDAAAPWNQGTWRIECAGGKLSAAKTTGAAGLSTDAAAFAAMYNGYLRPSEAVRSGLAQGEGAEAVALADRILGVDHPPYPSELF